MRTRKLLVFVLLIILALLTGCSTSLKGTYTGTTDIGLPVTLVFSEGNVQMNTMGLFTMNGTYKVSGNTVEITVNMYGETQTIRGGIKGKQLVFADMTLEKM